MKVTNTMNLPIILVDVCLKSQRKPKHESISCTELIDTPLIHNLKLKHWDELEVDVSETVKAMLGTALHQYIEKHAGEEEAEVALSREFMGYTITGTSDYMKNHVLSDWKTTSVWSVILGKEWLAKVEQQLQVYAWLWRGQGSEIRLLEIVAMFTDWKRSEKMRNEDYPRQNIQTYHFQPWTDAKVEQFIAERLEYFKDVDYVCSLDERWARPTTYAVMKDGRKSAVRVFDTSSEAETLLSTLDHHHTVVQRAGIHIRCEEYCVVRAVCKHKVADDE